MRKFLRQLQPGQQFTLLRTGERYTFVRREIGTPSGTRYIVQRQGSEYETRLHHSCHVSVGQVEGGQA